MAYKPSNRFGLALLLAVLLTGLAACQLPFQDSLTEPTLYPTLTNKYLITPVASGAAAETPVVVTQETTLEAQATPVPPDPWAGVDPANQLVYLWYFLPPGSRADAAFNQVVDQFNASNPYGIRVDAYNQSSATEMLTRTLGLANTPDMPALVMTNADLARRYWELDALLPLESLLDHPQWGLPAGDQAGLAAPMLAAARLPEAEAPLLALPFGRSASLLYANSEWLADLGIFAPPDNPPAFAEAACRATGQPMRRALVSSPRGYLFSPDLGLLAGWTTAFGGQIGMPGEGLYQLNSPQAVQAMTFLQDLVARGCAAPLEDPAQAAAQFAAGEVLFIQASSLEIGRYDQAVSQGLAFAWEAAPPPAASGAPAVYLFPGRDLSIARQSPAQMLAAWTFLRYLLSPAGGSLWAAASGEFPAQPAAIPGADLPGVFKQAFEIVAAGAGLPAPPGYDRLAPQVSQAILAIMDGADAQAALDRLARAAEAVNLNPFDEPE